VKELEALFPTLEQRNGLPQGLLRAVMLTESGGNPRAVSPAGASGLFQFMPATAKEYGIDPLHPVQSAEAAARKLAGLMKTYGGNLPKALQGYNWGEGNMASGRPMPAETRAYAPKVLAQMKPEKIDPNAVKWDAPKIDPGQVQWDEPAPAKKADAPRDIAGGILRGAGSIGATILSPVDAAVRALNGGKPLEIGGYRVAGFDRRAGMDEALDTAGVNRDAMAFKGGKIGTEIGGTLGVGGVLGKGAQALGASPKVVQALATGGFRTGAAPATMGARAADMALRSTAGGAVGGASAAMVNPEDALLGGAIGAALPPLVRGAAALGGVAKNAFRAVNPSGGQILRNALGVSPQEAAALSDALNSVPAEIVKDGPLTVAQALQAAGKNTPAVKMLERIAAGGPGGDALLKAYEQQAAARMAALQGAGAETYQGAAKDVATRTGDKVGAVLRTQAADDQAAARAAWERLHGQAAQEGVALRLPLDEMQRAMSPLGPGTVGAGKDAKSLMSAADQIGFYDVPSVAVGKAGAAPESLLDAVKRAGGINANTVSSKLLGGEVSSLKESGLGRVVYKNRGQSLAKMAEKMREAGFLPDEDPATLIQALKEGGRSTYSSGANTDSMYRAMLESSMGDAPEAQRFAKAVPFEEFQRLRRSAGELSAKPNLSPTESAVLADIRRALESKVDSAASGNLAADEVMPRGFREAYNSAREMTKRNAEKYKGGNNVTSILRKPVGQDYTLTGDEIANKIWHGGSGLGGDVRNVLNALSDNNREPVANALRNMVMTDAASKVKASGDLGSAFPKYIEARMPGLQELMSGEQFNALKSVASDIRNAEAAAAVNGLRGSDTQAKIARAMDAGLMDSGAAKALGRVLSVKGVGAESLRAKIADAVIQHKGKTVAQLMADPKAAAAALRDAGFVAQLPEKELGRLRLVAARSVPVLASSNRD
jgi:hypothetical protein